MKPSVLEAVRDVVEEYKRALRTSYCFYGEHLKAHFEVHVHQVDVVVRGPYVTLVPLRRFDAHNWGLRALPAGMEPTRGSGS